MKLSGPEKIAGVIAAVEIGLLTPLGPGHYATDASTIGWTPGRWPEQLIVDHGGMRTTALRRTRRIGGDEFGGFVYDQEDELRPGAVPLNVVVFND
jgi:hypothetical protein